MSLFGTSPTEPASTTASKSSLFDDSNDTSLSKGSGLFADEPSASGDSPWGFPTPKKQARGNIVKSLLAGADIPDSYIDRFDELRAAGEGTGNGVSLGGVKLLLNGSGLSLEQQTHVLNIVLPDGMEAAIETGLGRAEFNVLLALIGLAQEGDDVTLDGVDERRRRLPQPSLKPIKPAQPSQTSAVTPPKPVPQQQTPAATPSKASRNQPYNDADADPWGSSIHNRPHEQTTSYTNGTSNAANSSLMRTTSTITTSGEQPASSTTSSAVPTASNVGDWSTLGGTSDSVFSPPDLEDHGFGGSGGDQGAHPPPYRGPRAETSRISHGLDETVTVTLLTEKEGMFLFQYRNYQVSSTRRNSSVVRRYSDFVWLLDCLHKRYPFRQLPLLPPKRVSTADNLFIEKRRRGLARFANALVRHPVLSQEQLVVMFLTVPTELSVWRKQATIAVQEEFIGKTLPPNLEDSLPPTLEQSFDVVRSGVRRSAEIYIGLCSLLERLIKRKEGIAADYTRLAASLQTLTEASAETYHMDTNDVPMLNQGIGASARHMSTNQSILLDEARAWDEGVLEDVKRQRDGLVSMREMFDRRDKFAKDSIPTLEKRIASNESKLSAVRAKPEATRKPNEAEKLEDAIMKDKQSIVEQHARGIFIKECIRDEIITFQTSQYHVSRLCQDWSQERVKYVELQADNWRVLSEELESMPLGADS